MAARGKFYTTFTNNGTERYSVSFSDNTSAKNIFYDAWVYLASSASKIGNLEFDMNQTMDNGQTVMAGLPVRWLDWEMGLHSQYRQCRQPQASLGEQERYHLQSTELVRRQVAPRSGQHVER